MNNHHLQYKMERLRPKRTVALDRITKFHPSAKTKRYSTNSRIYVQNNPWLVKYYCAIGMYVYTPCAISISFGHLYKFPRVYYYAYADLYAQFNYISLDDSYRNFLQLKYPAHSFQVVINESTIINTNYIREMQKYKRI